VPGHHGSLPAGWHAALIAAGAVLLGACSGEPAAEPPAEPDAGQIGDAASDATADAEPAADRT
jgi:hypothetical protein